MKYVDIEYAQLKFDEEQYGLNPKKERKLRKIKDILNTMTPTTTETPKTGGGGCLDE